MRLPGIGLLVAAALLSGCIQEEVDYPPTSPNETDYFRQDNYYSDEERVEVLRSYEEHAQVKGGRFALANRNQHAALCDELRTAEGRERSVARDIYERYEPYLAQVNMAVILPPECTTGQCGEWFGEKYFQLETLVDEYPRYFIMTQAVACGWLWPEGKMPEEDYE